MALFKDFTFDGENSKDYGVYISGDAVYDAPERAMDMVQIPGRNGALALDNGYYNNIDVTYPAGCFADDQADFAAKLSRIRNMLASRHRYCRLEDAYHPDHFRMALYKSGLDVAPVARNKAGRFNITFDAKPQRFLKSGEVVQVLDADAPPTTSYGPADIVTFEGEPGDAIVHGQWPLEPVQDLHGYDAPWPADGGPNIYTGDYTVATDQYLQAGGTHAVLSTSLDPERSIIMPCEPNTQYRVRSGIGGTMRVGSFASSPVIGDVPNAFATATDTDNPVQLLLTTAGTDHYLFIQFFIDADVREIGATFEGALNGFYYSPYENICPINGFTGAEVTAKGVNLWDEETELGIINIDGTYTDSTTRIRSKNFCACLPDTAYYGFKGTDVSAAGIRYWDKNDNFVGYATSGVLNNRIFITPANAYKFKLSFADVYGATYNHDISINDPSTDTTYHASVGTTHNITWQDEAGTVYGGKLEYLGGDAWRLTKTMESVDMGTLSYTDVQQYLTGLFVANISGIERFADLLCDTYMTEEPTNSSSAFVDKADKSVFKWTGSSQPLRVYVLDSSYSSASDLATALDGHQLVYTLATPQVYDLTTDELQALVGINNIFSDTGTTTITVQSPYELTNPTLYPSKPLISVYGSGTIQVNDITITVAEHSGYIDIDCDVMDCHRGADSMNQYVSFSGNDFPELQPGINRILLNGPDKVEITPRWWEL